MPDNPIAGLYAAPPPPQQNALAGNPLQTANQFLQIQQLRQQMAAKTAVGNAFQNAVGPDGSFDPSKAMSGVAGDPNAAWGASDAIGAALDFRGKNIANATNQLALGLANNAGVATILAPYANKPTLSPEDTYNIKTKLAAAGIDPATVAAADLNGARKTANAAKLAAIQGMGPGAAASPVTGPVGPDGQPTQTSLGTRVQGNPTFATGQSPIQVADQQEYLTDQSSAAKTLANVRPLQQALPLVEQLSHFNFGQGSTDIAKVKGLLTTLGITGVDPTSELAVRQEVGKKLLGYASGAITAGRSDNALSAALGSNPNLDLTQPANLALIKNQIGMDRMDAALPLAAGNPNGYKNFKSGYYQSLDPRAFSFDLMTPAERGQLQKLLGGPNSPAYQKFVQSLQIAKKAGVIQPAPQNGQ